MARPKQLFTRAEEVRVRVSALEKKALAIMADQAGLSVSDYVRRAAFNQQMNVRFSPEELTLYKQLHNFRNNFAAITNLLKGKQGPTALIAEIQTLKEQMEAHLKKFEV
jgi:hypothetical protein